MKGRTKVIITPSKRIIELLVLMICDTNPLIVLYVSHFNKISIGTFSFLNQIQQLTFDILKAVTNSDKSRLNELVKEVN